MAAHITPPHPDHIFGDVDKPAKGSRWHREALLGLHHHSAHHLAFKGGEVNVTLTATSTTTLPVQAVGVVFSLDDWATSAEAPFSPAETEWDTVLWCWVRTWQVELPAFNRGTTIRYQVVGELPGGSRIYADNQADNPEHATPFALWLEPENSAPEWSESARLYQIFIDRFNPGCGRDWLQTEDIRQPMGGTLRGVTEKLGYIKELGFNAIWLTPIFKSPSHHGYDVCDYEQVEPRMGKEKDLRDLVKQAHALGMRVILDFVANHCSDQHPAFLKALADKTSEETRGFLWKRWPDYQSYAGVKTMPRLDLRLGTPARAHLLAAAQKWIGFGVDGYRLDVANGPDRDFWVDFQRACLEVDPECWIFGEVVGPASEQASLAGSMHGTLDFLTNQALRETFGTRTWPLARLAGFLESYGQQFPAGFSRPAFIDNHDQNRFLFTAGESRIALHDALTLLYMLPGQPIVYYGTESGLSQVGSVHDRTSRGSDEARLPMNWGFDLQNPTAVLLRELAAFREQNPWLRDARWHTLRLTEDRLEMTAILEKNSMAVTIELQGVQAQR